ncbi:MAG: lipocalin family protein [Flavobacteriales bacterium]
MKRSFYLYSILFVSLSLALSSCKYEEGPNISLRTKKSRLSGSWNVDKITENDGTVTTPTSNYSLTYEFDKDGEGTYTLEILGVKDITNLDWEFVDNKKKLKISYEDGNTITPTILRLTDEELIVNTQENDRWELSK